MARRCTSLRKPILRRSPKAIANDGITTLYGVPATYQRLLEYKAVKGI